MVFCLEDGGQLARPDGETTGINDNVFHEQCQSIPFLHSFAPILLSLVQFLSLGLGALSS